MDETTAIAALAALAQPTRLGVFRLLIEHEPAGLPAGAIALRLGVPHNTLSTHLGILDHAGLVEAERQGRSIVYRARIAAVRALTAFLNDDCCGGRPELCAAPGEDAVPYCASTIMPAETTPGRRLFMADRIYNVLFLCTHNSARSIMAEALLHQLGDRQFQAYSAGSQPIAAPLPEVMEKLRALGHDVSHLRSKSWNEFTGPDAPKMDFVIALCDTPEGLACPDFGNVAVTGAWPMPDPAQFTGSAVERTALLNELYASLRRRIEIFIALPFAALDRIAMKARLDEIGGGTPVVAGAR